MALEGFEAIAGKWVLVKNEGFDEYLSAMGVGYIKRKFAQAMTTKMELIQVEDNKIRVITKGPKDMDNTVAVDEEIEECDPFDNKIKVRVTWDKENKVMKTEAHPAEGSAAKLSIVERKIIEDGQLLMLVTLPNDNIVCRRVFVRDSV